MNDALKREFTRLSPEPGPPTALTTEDLIAGGRKRRTRRTLARVSGATTAVAVVAVAAVLLSSGLPGGTTAAPDERGAAADPSQAPKQESYELPELDPQHQYQFGLYDMPSETEATERLTEAFWKYLDDEVDGVRISVTEGEKTQTVKPKAGDEPKLMSQKEELLETPCADDSCQMDPAAESLLDRPTYQLMVEEAGDWGTDGQFVFGDREFSETFNVGLFPPGSFVSDPDNPIAKPYDTAKQPWFAGHLHDQYLVDGCADLDYEADGTKQHRRYDCDEVADPDGGRVLTVRRETTQDNAPGYVAYTNTVVVQRADGSAIRVSLESPGFSSCNGCGDQSGDNPPSLDIEQLTELALSLPKVTIE